MSSLSLSDLTVCVLHYGNHPDLAQRVMTPFYPDNMLDSGLDLRVGFNECSKTIKQISTSLFFDNLKNFVAITADPQLHKYPMMRCLLQARPLQKIVMWFDDDACPAPGWDGDWLQLLLDRFENSGADMMGSHRSIGLSDSQRKWIQTRPWYKGRMPQSKAVFCQGSWWMIRSDILTRHNWPDAELKHNGGDVMLGELCRQQGYKMVNDSKGMWINASDSGKADSSLRRGYRENPVGSKSA